ncbi:hypothetical protein SM139_3188 [Stenotrophomonas maltophilia]|nr:hypothetical protein SM139_3188 [Stenotrophomonas maltophilia]
MLEIGRNSVKPSRMPSSRAESRSDMDGACTRGGRKKGERIDDPRCTKRVRLVVGALVWCAAFCTRTGRPS